MKEKEKEKEKKKLTELLLEILRLPVRFILQLKKTMKMKKKAKEQEKEKQEEDEEVEMEDLNLALPHELIVEILLRLPVRSLLRFKCVCTSWCSLISHPQFARSHFDLAASPTHRLLLKRRTNHDSEIGSLDLEASFYNNSAVVNIKFPAYRAPYFRTLGSCRGLILLTKRTDPTLGDLIVWNPSTGAHMEIRMTYAVLNSWYDPSTSARQGIPPHSLSYLLYGFAYDPSKDDYFLVVIRLGNLEEEVIDYGYGRVSVRKYGGLEMTPRIEVFSVKTNVPSFIYGDELKYMVRGKESKSGLFLNQSLHWLVISKTTRLHVVIAFDLVERRLSEIPLSPDLAHELETFEDCYLRALGGVLGLCYSGGCDGHEMTEIWVMKEYKVQSSWTKSVVLSDHEMDFLPICFTPCGGVFGSDSRGRLKKFNDKGELLENHTDGLEYNGVKKYFVMYRESLLTLSSGPSLPSHTEEENGELEMLDSS